MKDHCSKGHPKTLENVYLHSDGWKECRICRAEKKRLYRKTPKGEAAQLREWIRWAEKRLAELEADGAE